jgi:hypothetical protein
MCGGFWLASDAPPGNAAVPSFCAPLGANLTCSPTSPTRATCQMARVDGESCDGDWDDVIGPTATTLRRCSPCAPGFRCVDNPSGATGPVCLRRADSSVGGSVACLATTANSGDRPYTYIVQNQRRFPLRSGPSGGWATAEVCVRAGQLGGMCGASIASNETRALQQNPTTVPVNSSYTPPGSLVTYTAVQVQFTTVDSTFPPNTNTTGCGSACSVCQSTSASVVYSTTPGMPNTYVPNEPRCCIPTGSRCNVDADCCEYGSLGASCVEDPTSDRDPETGAFTGIPRIKVCRRGCDPALGGNPTSPVAASVPSSFVCPAPTECRQVRTVPGYLGAPPTPVYACTPCGLLNEPACVTQYREGCTTVVPSSLGGGGIIRLGNLQVENGFCRPANCGFASGTCCPAHTNTIAPFAPSVAQGDRCQGTNMVCSSDTGPGTCVPCGGANQRCCEAKLSQFAERSTAPQPLSVNAQCSEQRNPAAVRTVPNRCPGDPIVPTSNRCATSLNMVCQNGSDPYTPGEAMCTACGTNGAPCCEGNRCNNFRSTCVGSGGGGININGICTACGDSGQPPCNCGGSGLGNDGCVLQDAEGNPVRLVNGICTAIPRKS